MRLHLRVWSGDRFQRSGLFSGASIGGVNSWRLDSMPTRRLLIRANEERIAGFTKASKAWFRSLAESLRQMQGLSLEKAHR